MERRTKIREIQQIKKNGIRENNMDRTFPNYFKGEVKVEATPQENVKS